MCSQVIYNKGFVKMQANSIHIALVPLHKWVSNFMCYYNVWLLHEINCVISQHVCAMFVHHSYGILSMWIADAYVCMGFPIHSMILTSSSITIARITTMHSHSSSAILYINMIIQEQSSLNCFKSPVDNYFCHRFMFYSLFA